MTRWPTTVDMYVCTTVSAPVITASAIMPPTSHESSVVSACGIALSRTSRNRNGVTIPAPALRTMSASTMASRRR
jgi:hypothetical protein